MKKFIAAIMMIALVVVMAVSVSAEETPLTEGIYEYVVNEDGTTVTITNINVTETGAVNIPATIAGKTVTAIGDKALNWGSSNTKVTALTIPEGVVSIGELAFGNNRAIKELVIPDSVKSLGAQAFCKLQALEKLTIGSGLETTGEGAFGRMIGLKEVKVNNNANYKVENGFLIDAKGKGVLAVINAGETVTIPAGIEYIDAYSFHANAKIKTIIISDGVKHIKESAFQATSLSTVVIPKSVERIGIMAFVNAKMGTGNVYYEGTEEEYKAITWEVNGDGATQNNDVSPANGNTPRGTINYNACMNNPNGWTHSEGETCTYCTPAGGNEGGNNTGNEGGNKAPQTGSAVTLLAVVAVVALAATSVVIKRRIED